MFIILFSNSSANIAAKIGKLTNCPFLLSQFNNYDFLLNGYLKLTLKS